MVQVVMWHPGCDTGYAVREGVTLLDERDFAASGVDQHLLATDEAGRVAARCSLWWRSTPDLDGEPTGLIGHYASAESTAGEALLRHACGVLRRQGAVHAVAPIDGSTWRSYRFMTERGDQPPFFLELDHPADWPEQVKAVGFVPLAQYFSARVTDLTHRQPKLVALENHLEQRGVTIRPIDNERFDEELSRIHALSLAAFASNFFYSAIDRDTFVAIYQPVRELIVPELVQLAERDGQLLGYSFALPDLLQARRGQLIDTVILKTLAIRPGREAAGLGGLLMERCHLTAHAMGFKQVIHALMHASNKSLSLSGRYGQPFRKYTLFSKRLPS